MELKVHLQFQCDKYTQLKRLIPKTNFFSAFIWLLSFCIISFLWSIFKIQQLNFKEKKIKKRKHTIQ